MMSNHSCFRKLTSPIWIAFMWVVVWVPIVVYWSECPFNCTCCEFLTFVPRGTFLSCQCAFWKLDWICSWGFVGDVVPTWLLLSLKTLFHQVFWISASPIPNHSHDHVQPNVPLSSCFHPKCPGNHVYGLFLLPLSDFINGILGLGLLYYLLQVWLLNSQVNYAHPKGWCASRLNQELRSCPRA